MSKDQPTNSILEVKLDYITKDIQTIKADVKEIKQDCISRREFDVALKDLSDKTLTQFITVNDKVSFLNKALWGVVTTVFLAIGTVFFKLILK